MQTKIVLFMVSQGMIFNVGCTVEKKAKNEITHPNVLFIVLDDLNDWVGCMNGHPDTKTPNMDRLAAQGMLFTNAHAAAPLCAPSRVAVFTGRNPSSSGFYLNRQTDFRGGIPGLVTLPQAFKENGYKTLGTGKMYHHDGESSDTLSWDEYIRTQNNEPLNTTPEGRFKRWVLDGGPLDIEDIEMADGANTEWAVTQLKTRNFEKPFFMGVGIFRPHIDWFAPRKYFEPFDPEKIAVAIVNENDLDDIPDFGKELALCTHDYQAMAKYGQTRIATAAYLACIHFADAMVGRLLDALDESPYADNTIVAVFSDNAYHLGQKLHWRKFTLWEESTKVPLIIRTPEMTNPGATSNVPVSLVDLYPTLLDLCNLPENNDNEGLSLVPLLRESDARWERPYVLTTYGRKNHALRGERHRYIRYSDGTEELYDRMNDPHEWTNLIGFSEYEEVREEMKKWLPNHDAPNQPDIQGNTDIKLWHHLFQHIIGQEIEFIEW